MQSFNVRNNGALSALLLGEVVVLLLELEALLPILAVHCDQQVLEIAGHETVLREVAA